MKKFSEYIYEGKLPTGVREKIKFTIWKEARKKITWLRDNNQSISQPDAEHEEYQKIDYKYADDKKGVYMQFLIGRELDEQADSSDNKMWKLWVGKIGMVGYDEDPWCKLMIEKDGKERPCADFAEAVNAAVDKIMEILEDVYENPKDYIQFYKEV